MAELMKRRSIKKAELLEICERQNIVTNRSVDGRGPIETWSVGQLKAWLREFAVCEYSGERIFGQDIDFDHKIPNALLYEGDKVEWQVILRKWHKVKTADDVARIAKAKRQAGEKGQYARRKNRGGSSIQSRGFQPKPEGYKYQWGKRGFGK